MSSDVTRDEVQHHQVRLDVLEREVEGEKMVTRHILEQTRRNSDDLAAIKSRLGRMEQRFDQVDKRFDQLDKKFDGLEKSLPSIVGEVIREVLRDRDDR